MLTLCHYYSLSVHRNFLQRRSDFTFSCKNTLSRSSLLCQCWPSVSESCTTYLTQCHCSQLFQRLKMVFTITDFLSISCLLEYLKVSLLQYIFSENDSGVGWVWDSTRVSMTYNMYIVHTRGVMIIQIYCSAQTSIFEPLFNLYMFLLWLWLSWQFSPLCTKT